MKKQDLPVALRDLEGTVKSLQDFRKVICSLTDKPTVMLALLESFAFEVLQADIFIKDLGGDCYSSINETLEFFYVARSAYKSVKPAE